MNEFGHQPEPIPESQQDFTQSNQRPLDTEYEERGRLRLNPPPFPAPFSQYQGPSTVAPPAAMESTIMQPKVQALHETYQEEKDDGSAGCCQCVVM